MNGIVSGMNIYKVNHFVDKNTIGEIRVFYGEYKKDLDTLF